MGQAGPRRFGREGPDNCFVFSGMGQARLLQGNVISIVRFRHFHRFRRIHSFSREGRCVLVSIVSIHSVVKDGGRQSVRRFVFIVNRVFISVISIVNILVCLD